MFRSLASCPMDDLESSIGHTEFNKSLYRLASLGPVDDRIKPSICPISSPCRMHKFRLSILRTMVFGPVNAAITDLASPSALAAGIIDPSEAHVRSLWGSCDSWRGKQLLFFGPSLAAVALFRPCKAIHISFLSVTSPPFSNFLFPS